MEKSYIEYNGTRVCIVWAIRVNTSEILLSIYYSLIVYSVLSVIGYSQVLREGVRALARAKIRLHRIVYIRVQPGVRRKMQ